MRGGLVRETIQTNNGPITSSPRKLHTPRRICVMNHGEPPRNAYVILFAVIGTYLSTIALTSGATLFAIPSCILRTKIARVFDKLVFIETNFRRKWAQILGLVRLRVFNRTYMIS